MTMIPCHTCGREVKHVRSVRIRRLVGYSPENDPGERGYKTYQKQMTFRRAFICPACYRALDTHYGVGKIVNPEGTELMWSLSGECRSGKAALYDHDKWVRYKRRKAADLGVDMEQSNGV